MHNKMIHFGIKIDILQKEVGVGGVIERPTDISSNNPYLLFACLSFPEMAGTLLVAA